MFGASFGVPAYLVVLPSCTEELLKVRCSRQATQGFLRLSQVVTQFAGMINQ